MRKFIPFLTILILLGCDSITSRNRIPNKNSVKIEKFNLSECLENCDLKSRIINQSLDNNIYSLTLGAHLNCAGNFDCEVETKTDTLNFKLFLKPNEKGIIEETSCNCFYNIEFTLSGINTLPKEILINGETLKENLERNADIIEIEE